MRDDWKNIKKAAKRYLDAIDILRIIQGKSQNFVLTIAIGDFQIMNAMIQIENMVKTIDGSSSNFMINGQVLASSTMISSLSDLLHSIFSVVDFNSLFKVDTNFTCKRENIKNKKKNEIKVLQEPIDISAKRFSLPATSYAAYGAIFIKAIEESKDADDAKLIFDSVCLQAAFSRKETSKDLFDYAYMKKRGELEKAEFLKTEIGIEELANGLTKHLYYSDGLFVFGVMNPYSSIRWRNKIEGKENNNFVHMVRYQAKHEFNVMLSSLVYSSMVVLAHDKIDDIFNRNFYGRLDCFARLSKIRSSAKTMSKMRLLYNGDSIFIKPSDRDLCKIVSRYIDVDFFEQQSREKTEMLWQEGNLNTGKKYGYISAFLAVIVFLFTGIATCFTASCLMAGIAEVCVSAIILIVLTILWLFDFFRWLGINNKGKNS